MKRGLLIGVLLLLYAAPLIERSGLGQGSRGRFDALQPGPRDVERAIASHRFADALPVALDLQKAYPQEALVAYWLAGIYHNLDRPAEEAAAWEDFKQRSSAPEEACPSLAQAYERMNDRTRALAEFERCTTLDSRNPDRFVDLGEAAERLGEHARALAAFAHAGDLDPTDPSVAARFRELSTRAGGL